MDNIDQFSPTTPAENAARPVPQTARPRIAIAGAGLAGLRAALELIDAGARVDMFDAAAQPGGNAWYEDLGGLQLPTAGSCFRHPEPGSEVDLLLRRIGLSHDWQSTGAAMQVLFRTSALTRNLPEVLAAFLRHPSSLLNPKVWGLTTRLAIAALTGKPLIPAEKALGDPIFHDLYAFLDRLHPAADGYPALPWVDGCGISRQEMAQLDQMTIRAFLFDAEAKRALPPRLRPPENLGRLIEMAVTTTLAVEGLLLNNCSAYVGLHFLVGYLRGDLVTCRGGNGAVSQAMLDKLRAEPGFTLTSSARVTEIRAQNQGYRVVIAEGETTRSVLCDAVVVATPKHIACQIVPDLPAQQRAAMEAIEYSDYAIVNAQLSAPIWNHSFGGYFIGDTPNAQDAASFCQAGGLVNASWDQLPQQGCKGGLTFLKPVPERPDQGKLATADAAMLNTAAKAEVRRAIRAVGADPDLIEKILVHRWPRGLVSPRPGQIAADLFVTATQSCGAIAFANQDSVGVGSLESATSAGLRAARQLVQLLDIPCHGAGRVHSTR